MSTKRNASSSAWRDEATGFLREFAKKSNYDLVFTQATALAYTSIASMVPLLAVAFFLFKAFGGFQVLEDKLQPYLAANLAPAFGDQIMAYLGDIDKKISGGAIGTFGFIGFILTSITTLSNIEKTFNRIWGAARLRSWGKRFTTYWSLLTLGPLLFGMSLALSARADAWLTSDHGDVAKALLFLLSLTPYFLTGILFSLLYYILPNAVVGWYEAWRAGLIAGIAFELAKRFYSYYVVHTIGGKASIYGSLAVLPLLLLWIYVAWLIVLFGAELCCYFQYRRAKIPYRFNFDRDINPLIISDILEVFVTNCKGPTKKLNFSFVLSEIKVTVEELNAHMDFLQRAGWIVPSKVGRKGTEFYLTCAADQIDMKQILHQLNQSAYSPKGRVSQAAEEKMRQVWDHFSHG